MRHAFLIAAVFGAVAGTAQAVPVQWTGAGSNGHWYEIDYNSYTTFGGAVAAAASSSYLGMTGYLATVTSAAEQAFLNTLNLNGELAWLGGSDAASEGNWEWVTEPGGPVAFSYTNWAGGEPNNCCGGENGLIGWWSGDAWNDLYDDSGYAGYAVIEYSPSEVPVPAGLPLLLGGIGALATLKRRAKRV